MNTATVPVAASHVWQTLRDMASAPYRSAGRFAWHFARGKLGMDPVFRHLLSRGLIAPRAKCQAKRPALRYGALAMSRSVCQT